MDVGKSARIRPDQERFGRVLSRGLLMNPGPMDVRLTIPDSWGPLLLKEALKWADES